MEGCCGSTVKYLVFLSNLLVFLAGLVSLGFGIYALATDDGNDRDDLIGSLDLDLGYGSDDSKIPEVVLVTASAIVVILTFLGCCGAIKESRLSVFLYFVILLVLSLAAVAGVTIAFGRSVEELRQPLLRSLSDYGGRSNKSKETTRKWDRVQIEYGCCGVDSFSDWSQYNPGMFSPDSKTGEVVPRSCCEPGLYLVQSLREQEEDNDEEQQEKNSSMNTTTPKPVNSVSSSSSSSSSRSSDLALARGTVVDCAKRPYDQAYADRTSGCLSALVFSSEAEDSVVAYVTIAIILAMVLNLIIIFGFGLCLVPKSAYQQVE